MPPRQTTKSPLQLARVSFAIAKQALATYSNRYSRHDFTQAQLFSLLVLRQFFQTDYRGIVQLVSEFSDVRRVLELTRVPHFTTLQKAEQRLLKKGPLSACWIAFSGEPRHNACGPAAPQDRSIPLDWRVTTSAATSSNAAAV